MTNDNNNQKTGDEKATGQTTSPDTKESVERGKAAIDAEKKLDDKPEEVSEKDGAKDASEWRNEG